MQIKVLSVLRKEIQGQDLGVRPRGTPPSLPEAQGTVRTNYARS